MFWLGTFDIFVESAEWFHFLVEEEIQSSRIFQLTVEICQTGDSISVSMVFSEFLDVAGIYWQQCIAESVDSANKLYSW